MPAPIFHQSILDLHRQFHESIRNLVFKQYPFDYDNILRRNFDVPSFSIFSPRQTKATDPKKHLITIDCTGYKPKAINTEIKDGKLYVTGKEYFKNENGDISTKEFQKTCDLPANADTDALFNFSYKSGALEVEVPIKEERHFEELFPKIIHSKDGTKKIVARFNIPTSIDPSKISVTCNGRLVTIYGEDVQENLVKTKKILYEKKFTMPENADLKLLKCHFDQHCMSIEAPIKQNL